MLVFWIILLAVAGIGMLSMTLHTQVHNGEMWREKAKAREEIERVDPARRGTIYSSDDKVLASTVPVCDLCLDLGRWSRCDVGVHYITDNNFRVYTDSITPQDSVLRLFVAQLPEVCKLLHKYFPNKSASYYCERILKELRKEKPSRCLYVERRVPYSQWSAIRALPVWDKCVVAKTSEGSVTSYVRAHIYGNMGENVIGIHYKTPQAEGYTGLEGYYDSVLRGQDGLYRCRRLTRGTWLPIEEGDAAPEDSTKLQSRIDGSSIIATIDTRYQDIAESALRSSMSQYGGQRGCAILMEVKTGYVLACSNLTRDTSGAISEMLWSNVAASDLYEPGSTFKTVAMLSMLMDAKNQLDTSKRVRSGGEKQYSKTSGIISDGHGYATDTSRLSGVLAKSSNIGMCELAWEYYRKRRADFKDGIEAIFPFGKLHPDLEVNEYTSSVVTLKSDRDFLNLSYGYSCMVSPLQLIAFYNAIANDGCMLKPLFCREILDGRRRSVIPPVVLNEQVCTPELAKQMREMLVGVVEHGTGSNIYNTVYGIAGKTGTTTGIIDKSDKNSSFVGFFPADNPRYTCLVLIEHTSIAGRQAAAPVFKRIADCVYAIDKELGSIRMTDSVRTARPVAPKADLASLQRAHQILGFPFVVNDSTPATGWLTYSDEQAGYVHYSRPEEVVPNCSGMTVRDAMELLRQVGYKCRFTGQGKVRRQTPAARTKARAGTTVTLELGY